MNARTTVFLCAVFLASTWAVTETESDYDLDWWEDSSLFHCYIRSFQDSDGDGIGDLNGVTSRLEYLKEIGINALWLAPFYKSPMFDMGYDISNFTEIEPVFGTMDDFRNLVEKAHSLDIKVILDMVFNHASIENEWFIKSVNREDGFDDVFIWADGKVDPNNSSNRLPPNNWVSDFGNSAWAWNEQRQQFYYHQFFIQQPDFNFRNPKTNELILDIFRFWIEQGVDGYRMDATIFFVEKQNEDGSYPDEEYVGQYTRFLPESLDLMYGWREFMDSKNQGESTKCLYSEAYATLDFVRDSYGNATHKGVHVPFNFDFVRTVFRNDGPADLNINSTAKDFEYFVDRWMDLMWNDTKTANWQTSNHDNPRVTTRLGVKRTDIMNMLIAGLPGISVTYYGEEIGMLDGPNGKDFRDNERTPMQWNRQANAGFSSASSTWLPLAPKYESLNVQAERGIARSTLNIFKQMHKLKKSKAFKSYKKPGAFQYEALTTNVFQIIRADPGKEEYRILLNFGDEVEVLKNLSNKTMRYFVANSFSPHSIDDKVNLAGKLVLHPYEGIVLYSSASK